MGIVHPPTSRVLLIGAGFSRHWGGWLAADAFEYLLGCSQIDAPLRVHLQNFQRGGGFEAALAHLQVEYKRTPTADAIDRMNRLQGAVLQMFRDMDSAFAAITQFEPQNYVARTVCAFLTRFDAIFTLNQDLLLERHDLNDNVLLLSNGKWGGWQMPGIKRPPPSGWPDIGAEKWLPMNPTDFHVDPRKQPFFKLHGSSNWFDGSGVELMVVGGSKLEFIKQHPILVWNQERFRAQLSLPRTKLMVFGYGFRDDYINNIIGECADRGTVEIFIIDSLGVDVLDKNRGALIYSRDAYYERLLPHIKGGSRRTVGEIFGSDLAEHAKVNRFLDQ